MNMTLRTLSFLCLLLAIGCSDPQPESKPSSTATNGEIFFPLKIGDKTLHARLAVLPAERAQGLMFVRQLEEDHGMLFISSRPEQQRFWMRNTPLPLDIGFFDSDGQLLEVYAMQPYDETTIESHSTQIRYTLEMNQGWFRKNKIYPGSRLDLSLVREALRNRNLDKQFP